jgi:hypothetical protein
VILIGVFYLFTIVKEYWDSGEKVILKEETTKVILKDRIKFLRPPMIVFSFTDVDRKKRKRKRIIFIPNSSDFDKSKHFSQQEGFI